MSANSFLRPQIADKNVGRELSADDLVGRARFGLRWVVGLGILGLLLPASAAAGPEQVQQVVGPVATPSGSGDVVYSQLDEPSGYAITDQEFEAAYAAYDAEAADDFVVADPQLAGCLVQVHEIDTVGFQSSPPFDPMLVNTTFYFDAGGMPGGTDRVVRLPRQPALPIGRIRQSDDRAARLLRKRGERALLDLAERSTGLHRRRRDPRLGHADDGEREPCSLAQSGRRLRHTLHGLGSDELALRCAWRGPALPGSERLRQLRSAAGSGDRSTRRPAADDRSGFRLRVDPPAA